jgi:hypothetical protein
MTEQQKTRWDKIKADFKRNMSLGGDDTDSGERIAMQLVDLVSQIGGIKDALSAKENLKADLNAEAQAAHTSAQPEPQSTVDNSVVIQQGLEQLIQALTHLKLPVPQVEVVNQPVPGIDKLLTTLADTFENSFLPLVKVMDGKINIDLGTHDKMHEISRDLKLVLDKDDSSGKEKDDPRFE